MTPERDRKHVLRALRTIPAEAIAPMIAADEAGGDGLCCVVGGELSFVRIDRGQFEVTFEDPLIPAQFARWLRAHPGRVLEAQEAAVAVVQPLLAARPDA